MRKALTQARTLENQLTLKLTAERSALPAVEQEPPFKDQIIKLDQEMRQRIAGAPLTPDEEREKSKLRTQEQANAFFERRKAKLAEQYRVEAQQFRDKTIAELRAEYDKRAVRNNELQTEIDRVTKLMAETRQRGTGLASDQDDRPHRGGQPPSVGDMAPILEDSARQVQRSGRDPLAVVRDRQHPETPRLTEASFDCGPDG